MEPGPENRRDVRLFFAIPFPKAVLDGLLAFQERLQLPLQDRTIRWTTQSQLHVTALFVGEVAEDKLPLLIADVRRRVLPHPFEIKATHLTFFPNTDSPKILVCLLDGGPSVEALHVELRAASRPFAILEEMPLRLHVTLARMNRPVPATLSEMTVRIPLPAGIQWNASEVALIQSHLSSNGASYRLQESFPLGGSL